MKPYSEGQTGQWRKKKNKYTFVKGQTMINETLHRNLRIEQHERN